MLQKFFKYILQSMAGMLGISVYILADTYFISVYSGADGLAVLNLILPVYGLIYAIGAMIGIGSATRYAIDRAQGKSASFYFLSAVTWDILISIPLVLAGIFIPDKILQLLGADAGPQPRSESSISALFWLPRLFLCPTTHSRRLRAMTALRRSRCSAPSPEVCSTSCLTTSSCFRQVWD